MLEEVVEHNVHVSVPIVHILGPNVHACLGLKNSRDNLMSGFFTKI